MSDELDEAQDMLSDLADLLERYKWPGMVRGYLDDAYEELMDYIEEMGNDH